MFLDEKNLVWNPAFVDRVRAKRRRQARQAEIERARNHQQFSVAGRLRATDIIKLVAWDYGLTLNDILAKRRDQRIDAVRKACIRAVKAHRPDLTTTQLGRIFQRDHSTILQTTGARHEPIL